MGNRAKSLQENLFPVRDILYGDNAGINEVEDFFYDNYIIDQPQNQKVIIDIMTKGGRTAMIAPTGGGKTYALMETAKKIVAKDNNRVVAFAFPTRMQSIQSKENYGAEKLISGDFMTQDKRIVGCTYEKMFEIKEYIERIKYKNPNEKVTLILDESHLCISQNHFRKESIGLIIKCIEDSYFDSVVLVTATPMPLALFHFDRIIEFQSSNPVKNIGEIEIVEVDGFQEYVKGLDYKKEFPFIRWNDKDIIKELIKTMRPVIGRISADDKEEQLYKDIIEKEEIDGSEWDGIFATSVLDAGTNIKRYPANITPMAVFDKRFLSVDDIEQFFNRTRNHVDCARVVIRKQKQGAIVELLSMDKKVLCTFDNVILSDNQLTVQDTDKMNSIPDGRYIMKISINGKIQNRKFQVSSVGPTDYCRYSKEDPIPILFYNVGFLSLVQILKSNKREVEEHQRTLQLLLDRMYQIRQGLTLQQEIIHQEQLDNELIEKMTLTGIEEKGELSVCMSYDNIKHKIILDARLLFMVSYSQYESQYLYYPELLKAELEKRMNTKVCIKEVVTQKGTKIIRDKDNIWKDIEDLRIWLSKKISDKMYDKIMGKCSIGRWDIDRTNIFELNEQIHLMEYLNKLKRYGITHTLALKILVASQSEKTINKYKSKYTMIIFNQMLKQCAEKDAKDVTMYNKQLKDKLQAAVFCWLQKKQQRTFTVTNNLIDEIIEYYKSQFSTMNTKPTHGKTKNMLNDMYKPHGKARRGELRTDENDIFDLVEADY